MVKVGEYKVAGMYQGGFSTLDPNKYSPSGVYTGYRIPSGQLGAPTKPDTANQIAQVHMLLNQGIIPIEIGALNPEVFDQIPKQHFKEINRMTKLTGAKISVHAPLIEASGIGEQGFTESARQMAEKQLLDVVEKSAEASDKGGMSITIHGAARIPGTEYKITPEGKKVEEKLFVVNKETGKLSAAFEEEQKFLPGTKDWKKGIIHTPREQIDLLNATEWDNSISQLMHHKEDAEARIHENLPLVPMELVKTLYENPEKARLLEPTQRAAYSRLVAADQFLNDTPQSLSTLFNKAYKFGTDEGKAKLRKASEQFEEDLKKGGYLIGKANAMESLLITLKEMEPQAYQPVEDFAIDKSATTFANVAFKAFDKLKDKAPNINVENFLPGTAFSHGKELDKLIVAARDKFVKQAVAKGYSESTAKEKAEELIGVTLDVGHLNMVKKHGFKDKDILKEVEEIAKHVKHVHLTDNFGYSDSHLPPGMGNVPMKDILAKLEQEGFEGSKIVEAGGFVQHFGVSPVPYALEAFGSQMYGADSPYWNQTVGLQQNYPGGFGQMLPQSNYNLRGAGFSQLPLELGGTRAGQGQETAKAA